MPKIPSSKTSFNEGLLTNWAVGRWLAINTSNPNNGGNYLYRWLVRNNQFRQEFPSFSKTFSISRQERTKRFILKSVNAEGLSIRGMPPLRYRILFSQGVRGAPWVSKCFWDVQFLLNRCKARQVRMCTLMSHTLFGQDPFGKRGSSRLLDQS